MRYFRILLLILILCLCSGGCGRDALIETLHSVSSPSASIEITGVPPEIQEMLWGNNDDELRARQEDYYQKYIDAEGIAIIGSDLTDDEILRMARDVVLEMTAKRPELRESLSAATGHYQILVNGRYEKDYDTPEGYPTQRTPAGWCVARYCISNYWDSGPRSANRVSGVLQTFVHEFGHAIHDAIQGMAGVDSEAKLEFWEEFFEENPGLRPLDVSFDQRLQQAYENAIKNNIWPAGSYRTTDHREYWAEGIETWFYDITSAPPRISSDRAVQMDKNFFKTHAEFTERDPLLAELLQEWFHETSFRGRY